MPCGRRSLRLSHADPVARESLLHSDRPGIWARVVPKAVRIRHEGVTVNHLPTQVEQSGRVQRDSSHHLRS